MGSGRTSEGGRGRGDRCCGVGDKPEFSHENRRLRLLFPPFLLPSSFNLHRDRTRRARAVTVTGDFAAAGDRWRGEIRRKRAGGTLGALAGSQKKTALIKMNSPANEIILSGDWMPSSSPGAPLSQKELFTSAPTQTALGAPAHAFYVTLISLLLFSTNTSSLDVERSSYTWPLTSVL